MITLPKKLKSQSGQFVTFFLVYPILILLAVYGVLIFVQSTTNSTQIRKQYANLKADYAVVKGISHVFYEIVSHTTTPFVSHTVANDNSLTPSLTAPSANIFGTGFTTDMIYTQGFEHPLTGEFVPSAATQFEAKIYTALNAEGEETYFALVKGKTTNEVRLYFIRLDGSPIYDFMYFFQDDVDFGWQNIDARGAKIHSNGNFRFNDSVTIDNVSELTTAGKFSWQYNPFVHPTDEASNLYFNRRWPNVMPTVYAANDPTNGNYVNRLDGHIAGTRPGLIVWNVNAFEEYDPANWATNSHYHPTLNNNLSVISGNYVDKPPIWPWGKGIPPSGYDNQYPNNLRRGVYLENNINCGQTPGTCATGMMSGDLIFNPANNQNLYHKSTKINGKYIPGMMNTSYPTKRYFGDHAGDGNYGVYATDSEYQESDWANFIDDFPSTVNGETVTGLTGLLKDARTGGKRITPPRIDVTALAKSAATSKKSMMIGINNSGEYRVKINNNDNIIVDPDNGYVNSCAPGQKLFEVKKFVNSKYATPETAVVVNISALKTCNTVQPNLWLPQNGIISNIKLDINSTGVSGYSTTPVSLVIDNAESLPSTGLTYIVNGNLFFKGHYNYNPSSPSAFAPSAAIVSDRVTLLSDSFDYPKRLPMTQHHLNYPAAWDYVGDGNSLPEGKGFASDYNGVDFNWQDKFDPDNPYSPNAKMANKVRGGQIVNGVGEYRYNVSLVGKYAVTPDFLELWNYYDDPGTASSAPVATSWRENKAIVSGSFVQLSKADFPPFNNVPTVSFNRSCDPSTHAGKVLQINSDGSTANFTSTSPCRDSANQSNPWDLIAANEREEQRYETRYKTGNSFPPGNLNGYADSFVIRIPLTDFNWTNHLLDLAS